MDFEQIRLAVEGRLYSWDGVPVAYDNAPAGPSVTEAQNNKDPWVRCVVQHGDSQTTSVGSGPKVRRTGLVMCQVFTDRKVSSKPAMDIASSLASHLEYYQDGKFLMRAASVNRIGDDGQGFYQINVTVPFVAD